MDENRINIAIEKCLTGTKDGQIVLQWLARCVADNSPIMVHTDKGIDPLFAAFRDGGLSAYRDILDRAGYRITYERKPDERDDNSPGPDDDNPDRAINPDRDPDNGADDLLA